jgi:NAD(P)-dependent dehydrogenase (short-subunit alcohol dehydrogenase family)
VELRFDDTVVVVTGAGGGLGRSYALELARRGARVVVNDLGGSVDGTGSDGGAAARVVEEITAAGGRAVASPHSVATRDGGQAIIDTALDSYGRIDGLISNAGILRPQAIAELDFDLLDLVLDVQLKGAFHVAVPAYRAMMRAGGGRIVTTTSGSVFGVSMQSNYATAKAGLIGLTRCLAAEGAEHGISANAVMPIATTRMTEEFLGPIAALLDPNFAVATTLWLAHPDCPANGEIIETGGGRVARVFLGETVGWTETDLTKHTVEAVRDHFEVIRTESGYAVPANFEEEMGLTVKAIS